MIPKELLKRCAPSRSRPRGWPTSSSRATTRRVFKGQGLAFREVRMYQPGDDVRTIDWNVSARMSAPS
jgi:uncharacterized protein (DUF58 family)